MGMQKVRHICFLLGLSTINTICGVNDIKHGLHKGRDANPPYLIGRLPIFINIFVHFDTQIWQPPYFWQVLCH